MMYKVLAHDQQIYGPVSDAQIRQWLAEGRVNADTLLLAEGSAQWRPLSSCPEFATPPVMQMPPAPKTKLDNDMAGAGLTFGLLSNVCCCGGTIFGILGLIFSIIALTRNEINPQRGGKGMAVAGLILSFIGLSWHLLLRLFFGGVTPFHALNFNHHWPWP